MQTLIAAWFILWDKEARAWLFDRPRGDIGLLRTVWCRLRGHPAGPWYYNPGGFAPDMDCKNCGDNLG